MARRINSSNTYTSPSNNEFMGQTKRTFSTNTNVRNNSSERSLKNMTNQLDNSENDGSNPIVCNCNEAASLLTVRKDGPNQGRQFYGCINRTCDFFQWLDSNINIGSTYGGNGGGGSSGGASNIRSYGITNVRNGSLDSNSKRTKSPEDSSSVSCECGNTTILYKFSIFFVSCYLNLYKLYA
jgi:hypothetical protein